LKFGGSKKLLDKKADLGNRKTAKGHVTGTAKSEIDKKTWKTKAEIGIGAKAKVEKKFGGG